MLHISISNMKSFHKEKSTYLLIVESPSKCAKIESYLYPKYKCISSKGHFRSMESYKNYELKFSSTDDKHIDFMHYAIKQYPKENVILATDDDREGEAISWHICDVFQLPIETTKRIVFNEITKSAIVNALENPKTIDMKLVHAQHARQVLDTIIGFNISPMLWKFAYNNKSNALSAGRCQTPALRLIYDNYLVHKENMLTKKHVVSGSFSPKEIIFTLKNSFDENEKVLVFLEKSKTFAHMLTVGDSKISSKSPPKPLCTSRLLQLANQQLKMSPKQTMQLAQILYQDGLITYMRTESTKYSKEFLDSAKKYIELKYDDKYLGDCTNIENTDAKMPHEAIRVTDLAKQSISREPKLNSLYSLIFKTTLESCMTDAVYEIVDCELTSPDNNLYKSTVETPLFMGWKIVRDNENITEIQAKNKTTIMYLKNISKNGKVNYNKITSVETITKKHTFYNEAGIIKKLEDLEIGRPSTFSIFVETLLQRGYIVKQNVEGETFETVDYELTNEIKKNKTKKTVGNESNKLIIQPIGIIIIEFLIQNYEELFSYDYTKSMEYELDNIFNGIIEDWTQVCKTCDLKIKELSKPLKNMSKQTYQIDDKHIFMFSKNGPMIKEDLGDDNFQFKSVKKDIALDISKLKNNEYTLEDLVQVSDNYLGKYQDEDLYIKYGKYGLYAEWGNNRRAMNTIKKSLECITFKDVEKILNNQEKSANVLRIINDEISVRKGKFGPYVYYKREDMSKPEFLSIKKFNEGFTYCKPEVLIQWLHEKYKIPIPE